MSVLPIVLRTARAERVMLAALGLLVLVTAFLVTALPCGLTALYDRAVHDAARDAPAGSTDLIINATLTRQAANGLPGLTRPPYPPGRLSGDSGLAGLEAGWRAGFDRPLRAAVRPVGYEGRTRSTAVTARASTERFIGDQEFALSWTAQAAQRVRYTAGRPPRPGAHVSRFDGGKARVVEVGLAARTASAMRINLGETLLSAPGNVPGLAMRVTGVYEPANPRDRFWRHWPGLVGPNVRPKLAGQTNTRRTSDKVVVGAAGLVHPADFAALYRDTDVFLEYTWQYEVALSRLPAARTAAVAEGVRHADLRVADTVVDNVTFRLTTRLGPLLDGMVAQFRAARAVLLVALAGLLGVAFGVLALALRLALTRLRRTLATMRARGGALRQLTLVAAGAVGLVALPATAAGMTLALTLPIGPYVPEALWGGLAVLAVALAVPGGVVVWSHRWPNTAPGAGGLAGRSGAGPRGFRRGGTGFAGRRRGGWGGRPGARRRGRAGGGPSPRRLVGEALVVTLALTGAFLLRQRGLTGAAVSGTDPGAADPFLVAVPVLLGLAGGLVALRLYPYPLRLLGRMAARRRSAVPFVGIAWAARGASVGALPIVVLLLSMSSTAFGAAVDGGLDRAQRLAAWQQVGADVRIDDIDPLVSGFDAAELAAIRRVRGVESVATARVFENSAQLIQASGETQGVRVVAMDLAGYRSVLRGTPLPAPPALGWDGHGPVPMLVSAPVAAEAAGRSAGGRAQVALNLSDSVTVRPVGRIGAFGGLPTGDAFVVLPAAALGGVRMQERPPTSVFVRGGHVDTAALRRAAGGGNAAGQVAVSVQERAYGQIRDLPLVTAVRTAFLIGAVAIVCYSAMAVLLILIAGAPARGALLGYLHTLGLSRRQARRLSLVEMVPPIAVAALAGFALGTLLPAIFGPGLDLSPYTGGTPVSGYSVDPVAGFLLAGGLAAVVAIGVLADAAISSRRGRARPSRREPSSEVRHE